MFGITIGFLLLVPGVFAGPAADCKEAANAWIDGLKPAGCPPLSRYRIAATTACQAIPDDGWTRGSKSARKTLLRDCAPTMEGFPGARATREDGRTLSHCSEMILLMRGVEADAPTITTSTVGVDGMVAAVGAALFACTQPELITSCRLPVSIHTDAEKLKKQMTDCQALLSPPFDTTMRSLVWNSGLLPIDPDVQARHIEEILAEQQRLKEQREQELQNFKEARANELTRAQTLAATCMAMPGDMKTPEDVDAAHTACEELAALWTGKDAVRQDLEAQGVLAEQYRSRLDGKVLNGESLNVADAKRVEARPAVLVTRKADIIKEQFQALIMTDPIAAEALIEKYRADLDPEWLADALDQILAATM